MAFGFQQLDASGNVLVDSTRSTLTLLKQIDNKNANLVKPGLGTSAVYWTGVTGLTSQADLQVNYLIIRDVSANFWWQWNGSQYDHNITYGNSPGRVLVSWNGPAGTTAAATRQSQNWSIYSLGKTL